MSRTFTPKFADILSEAFTRGTDFKPLDINQEHIEEALRSANLLLIEFSNRGVKQYQLIQQTHTTIANEQSFLLAAGVLDVWAAVLTRSGQDTPMWPMGRVDYFDIPNKANPGRPFNYFVNKGESGTTARSMFLWPAAQNNTDIVKYWAWMRNEDQLTMGQDAPMAYEWYDAYAANLAMRLARKYAKEKVADLKIEFEEAFKYAQAGGRERAPTRLRMRGYTKPRGGRYG